MKNKTILVSCMAFLTIALTLTIVSAAENSSDFIEITDIEVNGISVKLDNIGAAIAESISDEIPIVVKFKANRDASDVRVQVSLDGGGLREEVSDESERFHIIKGNSYIKRFTLDLPSSRELDKFESVDNDEIRAGKTKKLFFEVEVTADNERTIRDNFKVILELQRDQYSLDILSVDKNDIVIAGDILAIDVVIENNGHHRLDNVYVQASIPGLGISRKVYAGDLSALGDRFDDDINDARERRIYLTIPSNAPAGNYDLEIEAYNPDTSILASERVVVREIERVSSTTSRTIAPGEQTTFEVVLTNPSDKAVVYTITPDVVTGLFIEAVEPIITINPGSSRTTMIKVRASENAKEGTYFVTVNAESDVGLSQKLSLTINVEDSITPTDGEIGRPSTVVVLTVILVIVFIVLLIILIVLLTRRPEETEEFGETNYY